MDLGDLGMCIFRVLQGVLREQVQTPALQTDGQGPPQQVPTRLGGLERHLFHPKFVFLDRGTLNYSLYGTVNLSQGSLKRGASACPRGC